MPTPEELVAYLHRIVHGSGQVTNPTLVKDIHFQMGQMVLALLNARNTLRRIEQGEAPILEDDVRAMTKEVADMIDQVLKGEL